MSLIDKAKAHWTSISSGSVKVPEWDEVIHFKRMTLEEIARWQKDLESNPLETGVKIIIDRATDGQGKRLFSGDLEDFTGLMGSADPKVIERIAVAIMAPPTAAAARKN